MPAFFCGLIDDVLQALLSRSCPSYFLPQINLLDKTDDTTILSLGKIIRVSAIYKKPLCDSSISVAFYQGEFRGQMTRLFCIGTRLTISYSL